MGTKQTVTGDDGTKYEIQDDGTLRKVEGSSGEPPTISMRDSSHDRPLTWSELRDRTETVEATKEVPEELRGLWSDLSTNRRIAVSTIRRSADERADRTSGHRPPWVGSALKPRAAPRRPRPRVQHRGVPLDPLVVWGADERLVYSDTKSAFQNRCWWSRKFRQMRMQPRVRKASWTSSWRS